VLPHEWLLLYRKCVRASMLGGTGVLSVHSTSEKDGLFRAFGTGVV
jgi:hypothetical protein